MDKQVIYEYADARAIEQTTEEELKRFWSGSTVCDKVTGSNPDFPYNPQSFSVSGIPEDDYLVKREKVLKDRLMKARETRINAEAVINAAPLRIQRIINLKIIRNLSWTEVADIMHARSGDSIRVEFWRWMKKK